MAPSRHSPTREGEDPAAKRPRVAEDAAASAGFDVCTSRGLRQHLLYEFQRVLDPRGERDDLLPLTQAQWRSVASISALMVACDSGNFDCVAKGEITDSAMLSLAALAEVSLGSLGPTDDGFDREYALGECNHRLRFLTKLTDAQLCSEAVYGVLKRAVSLDPQEYFGCVPWRLPLRHPKFEELAETAATVHRMSWRAIPSHLRTKEHMCAAVAKYPGQLGSLEGPKGLYDWEVVEAAIVSDMDLAMKGLEAEDRSRIHNTHSTVFANHAAKVIHAMPPEWRDASELTGKPDRAEADRRMREALLANPKANLPWVCEVRPDLLDPGMRIAFLRLHRAVLDACCEECGEWYPVEWWVGLIWGGPADAYHHHGYGITAVKGQCTIQQVTDHADELGLDTTVARLRV